MSTSSLADTWGKDAVEPVLVFRAGGVLAALPIAHVVETLRPLPIAPLGRAPAFVRGVAVIRGRATPVVDTAALVAGGAPTAERAGARFVCVRADGRVLALAVDEVVGVQRFAAAALDELPGFLGVAAAEIVDGLGAHGRELLVLLRAARLVPDSVWAALEGGAA